MSYSTIAVSEKTHEKLRRIKGEKLIKGEDASYDTIISELLKLCEKQNQNQEVEATV